jgi:leukotriene-A4 hydrolase
VFYSSDVCSKVENPNLTFCTPTLLAGDRSLASVVAHEIAHSWFGNYVTSETWESFWMNEGFTVFLERKIVKSLKGKEHQGQGDGGRGLLSAERGSLAHASPRMCVHVVSLVKLDLHAQIGLGDLQKSVDRFGADHPFTCLCPRLQGVDPDDAFSSVPYEKGFNFLTYLEANILGEETMNKYLRAHCVKYAHSVVNSDGWKEFFLDWCRHEAKIPEEKLASIDWETWFHKPGMPPVKNVFDQSLIKGSQELADTLLSGGAGDAAVKADAMQGWDSSQVVILLERILAAQKDALAGGMDSENAKSFSERLQHIDTVFQFTNSRNAEVRFRWLTLCIRQGFSDRFGKVGEFLREQGRMKYIRPLYRDLFEKGGDAREFAIKLFQEIRKSYHAIASKMVAKDLQLA